MMRVMHCEAVVVVGLLAAACGPGDAGHHSGVRPRSGGAVLSADAATRLVARFRFRADRCFAQVFREGTGHPMQAADRRDKSRRAKALDRLAGELRSCLTGRGYGGQVMIRADVVRRWLAVDGCEELARQALRSKACFALQGALDAVGFPIRRPAARASAARAPAARPCANPEGGDARGYYAASHILISFLGASRAAAHVSRSKAGAYQRALHVSALARRPGADFGAVARQYSDGPSRTRGGRLGSFPLNRMVPAFSNHLRTLCIGQVSGPVLTRFGYHVIRRNRP